MKLFSRYLPAVVGVVILSGCGKENQFVPPPPPEVGVQPPVIENATVYTEYAGRTSGFSRVEIRARVTGFLKAKHFDAGQFVDEGDLLFTIEPEQFQAAVKTAEGNLAKAEADLDIANTNYEKRKQAFEGSGAVSEIDVLSADAERKAAEAGVDIANANLSDAKRDLGYTEIHAPISGRISNERVDLGNLVGASDPTLLTDIITVEPIYFNFDVSERQILRYLGGMPSKGQPTGGGEGKQLNLQLVLANGKVVDELGRFDFVDNTINPDSGTVKTRAIFKNEGGYLAAGLFARIRVPEEVESSVQVPAFAIQRDLGGSFILVVGPDNIVERRVVVPTQLSVDALKIIEPFNETTGTGVKAEELIVVSNLQRAREGLEVVPVASEPGAPKRAPDASKEESEAQPEAEAPEEGAPSKDKEGETPVESEKKPEE